MIFTGQNMEMSGAHPLDIEFQFFNGEDVFQLVFALTYNNDCLPALEG